jgi:two-component system cell cycle sensor histidine kinase PleC
VKQRAFAAVNDTAFIAADGLADERQFTAGRLALAAPTLPASASCAEAFDWLIANPGVPAAALLDDSGRIAGLVSRQIFFARYARQYIPELFARKPVLRLANTDPLIVDENVRVADLGATMVVENPEALVECFVVTSRGRYRGIGTGEALLRGKVALLQAQEAELRRALVAAHDASRAKSNFLALMSHELRTPLNAIIGFSEVMGGELFGPLDARYRDYAHDIHGAGRHLLALINDILDLSKAEAGKLEHHPEPLVPGELIQECLRLVRGRAREAGLTLSATVAPGMPQLHLDRLRLKQVLLNLLSNALKFTPRGGHVAVEAHRHGAGEAEIVVRDTGIGIAPEMIAVALEPFRQIASPLARNAEGTGLGLALVKSMVEMQDGRLVLESTLNQGTAARILFPPARCLPELSQTA